MGTLLLTTWSLTGCYTFVPTVAPVPSGAEVQVTLTAGGSTTLTPVVGPNVREVEGTVIRVTRDTLVLAVSQSTTMTGERFVQSGTTVAIATNQMERTGLRQLSRRRTAGLVVAIVAVLAAALSAVAGGSLSGDGLPGTIQP
ncbi:MAG: hypothetical protein WCK74_08980 [Gemmatimonadaceae bacterium]